MRCTALLFLASTPFQHEHQAFPAFFFWDQGTSREEVTRGRPFHALFNLRQKRQKGVEKIISKNLKLAYLPSPTSVQQSNTSDLEDSNSQSHPCGHPANIPFVPIFLSSFWIDDHEVLQYSLDSHPLDQCNTLRRPAPFAHPSMRTNYSCGLLSTK